MTGKADGIGKPAPAFWLINTAGWLLIVFVNITFQTRYFTENFDAVSYSFLIAGVGFLATILLRYLVLRLQLVKKKLVTALPLVVVLSICVSIICVLLFTALIVAFFPEKTFSLGMLYGNMFNFSLVLIIWTLLYTGYLLFTNQRELTTQKLALSLQLKQAEITNLRKQLSPHFLFNAINNIRSLVLVNPEQARDALLHVSDILRYALTYQEKSKVLLSEEMEVVEAYIELNRLHLGKEVTFKVRVDPGLDDLMIPPMTVQLLVENAVKHGELVAGTKVDLEVYKDGDKTYIKVTNHGELDKTFKEGIGLSSLRYRFDDLYGDRYNFSIFEKDDRVTALLEIDTDADHRRL